MPDFNTGVYVKRDLTVVRGEGARLWASDGRPYIDCVGGQGAANLGHCHPAIVEAVQRQLTELTVCPEAFHYEPRAAFKAELCGAAGMQAAYLCNSGAEAVEAALKFARITTGRSGIIAAMRGFHGRTMGALSTTWNRKYRRPFEPLIPGVAHVPFNDAERLITSLDDNTAAVLLEVVQGEGGVHPAAPGYLQAVAQACHANGSLLIIDEVQTGFGRTGSLFAFQQEGIQPDLLCLAKSIAGGLPMGAVLLSKRVGRLPPGSHGSTFGGGPVAIAAARAALDVYLHTGLIERARRLGEAACTRLSASLPARSVREVRGRGLMIGVELRHKVAPVLRALQERGVLALSAGLTVLRLLPPLVILEEDLWQAVTAIEEILHDAA